LILIELTSVVQWYASLLWNAVTTVQVLHWTVAFFGLFFAKKCCAKKRSGARDSNLRPAACLVQALPLHHFSIRSCVLNSLYLYCFYCAAGQLAVRDWLVTRWQHAIRQVLLDADRLGIYPFNLELKFVAGFSLSYLIQI